MNIIGEVEGKSCVLVDDMVDTAGTLCHAAKALKDVGAKRVVAYITHPCCRARRCERIEDSELDELVVTDTIPLRDEARKVPQDPAAVRGGIAGGDHAPHPRRGERELAVHRLTADGPRKARLP